MEDIKVTPIGFVQNDVHVRKHHAWGENVSTIVLKEEYAGGLAGLDDFSHAIVLFHLDKAKYDRERHLQRHPQNRDDMPLVGIFAQRGKDRPNQMGITSVEVVSVSDDALVVRGLDAIDGTPIIDIKPYYPMYDSRNATVPEWVERLMERYF